MWTSGYGKWVLQIALRYNTVASVRALIDACDLRLTSLHGVYRTKATRVAPRAAHGAPSFVHTPHTGRTKRTDGDDDVGVGDSDRRIPQESSGQATAGRKQRRRPNRTYDASAGTNGVQQPTTPSPTQHPTTHSPASAYTEYNDIPQSVQAPPPPPAGMHVRDFMVPGEKENTRAGVVQEIPRGIVPRPVPPPPGTTPMHRSGMEGTRW